MAYSLQIDLFQIQQLAAQKQKENIQFHDFIKSFESEEVDKLVAKIDEQVSFQIDCTNCGNCCKTLMINVEDHEADTLAKHLSISRHHFDEQYLEKGTNGMMLMNTIPCSFLKNKKCTVYENRFSGCREFPGLQLPGIKKRVFTILMHYDRCPIIFNVIELLKLKLEFKQS